MTSKRRSSRASGKSATAAAEATSAPRRSRQTNTKSLASRSRSKATSTPERLPSRDSTILTRYRFVGGKGGVGKTTCAAALGVSAPARGAGENQNSTDPASSLADAFQLPPLRSPDPNRPRRVPTARGTLHVIEIDAARAIDQWVAARRSALERIALRGTWLDEDDVSRLLRLSLPGIDEMAALFEIARAGRSGDYDLVVVDTAPTGHTLRMLLMPDTLVAMARVFDHMQEKHRVMVAALRGGWTPDAEDRLIEELARDGDDLAALLRDPSRVCLAWVSLPEPMAVEEAADAAARLREAGIPLEKVVINRVTPRPAVRCGWCDARRAFEAPAIGMVRDRIPGVGIVVVAERDREPRDVRAFAAIGRELDVPARIPMRARGRAPRQWRASLPVRSAALPALTRRSATLLLFGGKGGTGKTTCAAASAIDAAREALERRVLLLSVDPAHSLADVLGIIASDVPRTIPGAPSNLFVRELDAMREFAAVRARYSGAIDLLFDRLSRGAGAIDVTSDRIVMHDLIDLAPPGIDELAAIIDVIDALDDGGRDGYGLIVVDTAPTGHALRLLETPALVQDWVRALMSIVLKYQPVVGIGELGAVLLKLSQGLGRIRQLLVDSARCRFVAVTRAAVLPAAETIRLVARLRRMGIDVPAVVVNAAGRGTCVRCRRAAAAEKRELEKTCRAVTASPYRDTATIIAPAEMPPPHGVDALSRWFSNWRRIERPAGA